ncbi:MAG: hypothetical protein HFI86_00115 [Bacilli bacterium]|nr:hypothetical protein [Bacilli bacterium]MCI9433666.1 hypothetical protein [Bacilli bacterium]
MKSLSMQIEELERKVKNITRTKQKKNMSPEVMKHFSKVLAGIDELNKSVLKYDGTNIFLCAKLKENAVMNNYVQY